MCERSHEKLEISQENTVMKMPIIYSSILAQETVLNADERRRAIEINFEMSFPFKDPQITPCRYATEIHE